MLKASKAAAPAALPLNLCLAWGLGTFGISLMFNTVNVVLARFATDYLGIAAGTFASLFALAKLADAIVDPLIGIASDRTRSPWGRRRPWLAAGGILCVAGFLALFFLPDARQSTGVVPLATAGLLLYALGYAAFNVPYMAMPAEMTRGYHERARLVAFRVVAIGFGTIAGVSAAPVLIGLLGGGRTGHQRMALVFAAAALVATLGCALGTASATATRPVAAALPLSERIRIAFGNRPFALLVGIKWLQLSALAASQVVLVYFFLHVLGRSYQFLGLYGLVASTGIILSTWLWLRLSRRHGKRLVYLFAGILYALVSASWFWVSGQDALWSFLWRAALGGFASGGLLLMGQAMLPDAIEHDAQRSGGMRREGLFAGFYTTAEKLAGAVGVAATGAVLQAAGYVPSYSGGAAQPPGALLAIRACFSFAPALLTLLSCLLLLPYRLDDTLRSRVTHEPQ